MKRIVSRPIKDIALGIYDGPHATPKETEHGPIFLGISEITPDGRLRTERAKRLSEADFETWTRRVTPQENDIVFTYEATLHRYALLPSDFRACLGRRLGLVRPNPKIVVPKWLHYYMLSAQWRSVIESNVVSGATVDRIPIKRFPDFPVHVPPLSLQESAVEILGPYDDLIENNRRRMALLELAARQLYDEWFVRLRFPGHERTRIVDGVPLDWRRVFLGDFIDRSLVNLQTGPFGTQLKASDYTESGTPVINVRNIGYGGLRPDKLEFVPEQIVERLGVHILKTGDIVFGRKGAVDRHLFISPAQNGWMQGSDCIRLRVLSDEVCPILLSFAFRKESHKEWMLTQCGNKATMASLNQEVISRIPVIVPPTKVLCGFQAFASDVLSQIAVLAQQNEILRTARDLLLPRLMSGEIEV